MVPWVRATGGPPAMMKTKDGRKVDHVTNTAPGSAATSFADGPNGAWVQPPTKPAKVTTMISGPGIVSPSARPSIIWVGVSQW